MKTTVLWELASLNDPPARCAYECSHVPPHVVTVTVGDITTIREPLSTEAEAVEEASYLFEHYVLGGWTEMIYRDARLVKAVS